MPSLYSLLNQEAKAWWYYKELRERGAHKEARKKERESILGHIKYIRDTLANGGHVTMGRGGFTLHISDNQTLSGYGDQFFNACIQAGIKGWDSRHCDFMDVARVVIGMPMVSISRRNNDGMPYSLSYTSFDTVARAYKKIGAKLYNCELAKEAPPEPKQESLF